MGFAPPNIKAASRPMQVRFFQEPDIADLESAINGWLSDHPRCEIVEVRQTAITGKPGAVEELIVSVWYIED